MNVTVQQHYIFWRSGRLYVQWVCGAGPIARIYGPTERLQAGGMLCYLLYLVIAYGIGRESDFQLAPL